jgi:ATP-dependent protease ClpP protease subunit
MTSANTDILILGFIDEANYLKIMEQLRGVVGSSITLIIDCVGGSWSAIQSIHKYLKIQKSRGKFINAINIGTCSQAPLLLFATADKRSAYRDAVFRIDPGKVSGLTESDTEVLRRALARAQEDYDYLGELLHDDNREDACVYSAEDFSYNHDQKMEIIN